LSQTAVRILTRALNLPPAEQGISYESPENEGIKEARALLTSCTTTLSPRHSSRRALQPSRPGTPHVVRCNPLAQALLTSCAATLSPRHSSRRALQPSRPGTPHVVHCNPLAQALLTSCAATLSPKHSSRRALQPSRPSTPHVVRCNPLAQALLTSCAATLSPKHSSRRALQPSRPGTPHVVRYNPRPLPLPGGKAAKTPKYFSALLAFAATSSGRMPALFVRLGCLTLLRGSSAHTSRTANAGWA